MPASDYPKALYHTAVRRPRDAFGNIIPGPPIHMGDLVNPSLPVPGKDGVLHEHPRHHYRTTLVVVRDAKGNVDEEASQHQEEELRKQGWVDHPSQLKEEYED